MFNGLDAAVQAANERVMSKETYYKSRERLRRCVECQEPVECEVDLHDGQGLRVVGCNCECDKELLRLSRERELETHKQLAISNNISNGISDSRYLTYRWEIDDSPSTEESQLCRRYADNWAQMKSHCIGLLLSGTVGAGKTFYGACIANQLLSQGVRVGMVTMTDLIGRLFSAQDKEAVIRWIQSFDLLILDDFGAERDTEYAKEQVFAIVDARSRSGKPTIFTTNLTRVQMEQATDQTNQRINDRVLEMAPVTISFQKKSRRIDKSASLYGQGLKILMGEM